MKLTNPIGWCDETSNAVTGCDKVSPGCKNCYAQVGTRARVLRSQGIETWGPKGVRHPVAEFAKKIRRLNKLCICMECRTTHPVDRLKNKDRWCYGYPSGPNYQQCYGELRRIRLFADSNSDWLDEKWPIETLADFLREIHDTPNVDVLLLTKRPENWHERMSHVYEENRDSEWVWMLRDWLANDGPPNNLWFGVSVENQKCADERIPQAIRIPSHVRFLSVEPLLEQVKIGQYLVGEIPYKPGYSPTTYNLIDWVIVGGESGKDRRDCGVLAIEDVVAQCVLARVPVYCKQASARLPGQQGAISAAMWNLKQFPGDVR